MSHNTDSVQNSYSMTLDDGLPGSTADANPTVKNSYVAEGDIGYGVVISRGSTSNVLGGSRTGRIGATGAIAATAGTAQGTGVLETDIGAWNAITDGTFTVSIDGVENDISAIDTSAAADLAAVAAILQVRLRIPAAGGFTLATVAYDAGGGHFIITSGTTGAASTVSDLSETSPAAGTDVHLISGMDTAFNIDGLAVTSLVVLGITQRTLISESVSILDSGNVVTKDGEIGVVLSEGTIKVIAQEAAADNADVYFDDATGLIFASAAGGRTQLGSAKWIGATATGKVGIVDVTGVRGA